jgi:hypothetical protein
MKMSVIKAMVPAIAMAVSGWFAGAARAADPEAERGLYIKNLMSPAYRPPAAALATQKELTKRDIKRLTKTAETREDHLKIARFWTAEANELEAQAAGYEHAAAAFRRGPVVKNLMAPNTAARWQFLAKELRNEATADRARASHEQMAREA